MSAASGHRGVPGCRGGLSARPPPAAGGARRPRALVPRVQPRPPRRLRGRTAHAALHPPPCRLDFGSKPIERQLILSAQFLHNELPVRLSHRVAELENLPYGLSAKPHVLKVLQGWWARGRGRARGRRWLSLPRRAAAARQRTVLCAADNAQPTSHLRSPGLCPTTLVRSNRATQVRDWYVESFRELRSFPKVKDASDELHFTRLLQHIYRRHTNVVPVMAMGVAGARAGRCVQCYTVRRSSSDALGWGQGSDCGCSRW